MLTVTLTFCPGFKPVTVAVAEFLRLGGLGFAAGAVARTFAAAAFAAAATLTATSAVAMAFVAAAFLVSDSIFNVTTSAA